jgi:hypothetical protein
MALIPLLVFFKLNKIMGYNGNQIRHKKKHTNRKCRKEILSYN